MSGKIGSKTVNDRCTHAKMCSGRNQRRHIVTSFKMLAAYRAIDIME